MSDTTPDQQMNADSNRPQSNPTDVNNKKVYVGNLPYTMTEDDLQQLFGQYGQVGQVTLIIDKMSGRSKGFGFVEMSTDEEATAAIEALNGTEVDGRALIVNIARPLAPREDRGGFRPRFNDRQGGGRPSFGGGRSGGNDRRGGGYGGGRNSY